MHHALSCFVEHRPHHLIATARYFAAPIDLARLIPGAGQPKHRPDGLGFAEPGWHIDGGAIGQRHHGADTRDRHQAPAYLVLPDDGQQAAVQDDDLFTEHPPDDEQRLRHYRQVGDILDKLLDAGLEPHLANHSNLGPKLRKVPRRSFSMAMALDCNSLRWVSSIRSFWLRSVFTCTGRYSPTRII